MESLAYTIIHLLRGHLPWMREKTSKALYEAKYLWSGNDLCTGYPAAFGEFIDYARKLQSQEEPAYASWMDRFRNLPQHGHGIANQPIGKSFKDIVELTSLPPIPSPPASTDGWYIPFEEYDGYVPNVGMNIQCGRVPTRRDQIGNEKDTVRQHLARLRDIPALEEEICCGKPELLLTWEEEDEEEKDFGQKYLEEIDN